MLAGRLLVLWKANFLTAELSPHERLSQHLAVLRGECLALLHHTRFDFHDAWTATFCCSGRALRLQRSSEIHIRLG